jgi:hypothetical protein
MAHVSHAGLLAGGVLYGARGGIVRHPTISVSGRAGCVMLSRQEGR